MHGHARPTQICTTLHRSNRYCNLLRFAINIIVGTRGVSISFEMVLLKFSIPSVIRNYQSWLRFIYYNQSQNINNYSFRNLIKNYDKNSLLDNFTKRMAIGPVYHVFYYYYFPQKNFSLFYYTSWNCKFDTSATLHRYIIVHTISTQIFVKRVERKKKLENNKYHLIRLASIIFEFIVYNLVVYLRFQNCV